MGGRGWSAASAVYCLVLFIGDSWMLNAVEANVLILAVEIGTELLWGVVP